MPGAHSTRPSVAHQHWGSLPLGQHRGFPRLRCRMWALRGAPPGADVAFGATNAASARRCAGTNGGNASVAHRGVQRHVRYVRRPLRCHQFVRDRQLRRAEPPRLGSCQTSVQASLRLHSRHQVGANVRVGVLTDPQGEPLRGLAFAQHPGSPVRELAVGLNNACSVCGAEGSRSPPFGGKQEIQLHWTSSLRVMLVAPHSRC